MKYFFIPYPRGGFEPHFLVKNSFEGNDINYPSAWEIIEKLNTSLLSELWNYEYSQLF